MYHRSVHDAVNNKHIARTSSARRYSIKRLYAVNWVSNPTHKSVSAVVTGCRTPSVSAMVVRLLRMLNDFHCGVQLTAVWVMTARSVVVAAAAVMREVFVQLVYGFHGNDSEPDAHVCRYNVHETETSENAIGMNAQLSSLNNNHTLSHLHGACTYSL